MLVNHYGLKLTQTGFAFLGLLMLRWSKFRSLVVFSCASLCLSFTSQPAEATCIAQEPVAAPLSESDRTQAKSLVSQLSAQSYAARQRASEQLWQMGPSIIPLIESVADSPDAEVATRSRKLLTLLRLNVSPDSPNEVVDLAAKFASSDAFAKERLLRRLVELQHSEVAMNLLETIESEENRHEFFDVCFDVPSIAEKLVLSKQQDKLERVLTHRMVQEYAPELPMYLRWKDGGLDSIVGELKTKSDSDAGLTAAERERLVGLLRFKREYVEALAYAEEIEDPEVRDRLTHVMLMESGNWATLAERIVADDSESSAFEGGYYATQYEQALIYFFANDFEKQERAVTAIEASIKEMEEALNSLDESTENVYRRMQLEEGVTREHVKLARLLLYMLDWDRALPHLDLKRDMDSLNTCLAVNRYDLMFKTMGISEDYASRRQFFSRQILEINKLFNKAEVFRKEKRFNDWKQKSEETDAKRLELIQLYLELTAQIAHLGYEEEAEYYLRQLFFKTANQEIPEERGNAVESLINIGANRTAWELLDIISTESVNLQFFNSMFPGPEVPVDPAYKRFLAETLNDLLKEKYPDTNVRLRKIAHFLKSPLRHDIVDEKLREFDFETEVQVVRDKAGANDSDIAYLLFNLYELHSSADETKEADFWLERSTDSERFYHSKTRMAKLHYRKSEFLKAAELYELVARSDRLSVFFAQAADAYRKGGNEERARTMDLMVILNWPESNPGNVLTSFSYQDLTKLLPYEWFRLKACLASGGLDFDRWLLSTSVTPFNGKVEDLVETANQSRMLQLDYVGNGYFGRSGSQMATMGVRDMGFAIRALVQEGKFDAAMERFLPLNEFNPADSGLAEFALPEMQQAGASQHAEKMFSQLSAGFFDTMKQYPNSTLHNNNYAWMCACGKQKLEFVERHALKAIELRPNSSGYLDTLAEVYFAQGKFDLAIETIKKAIEIFPTREYYREQLLRFQKAKEANQGAANAELP